MHKSCYGCYYEVARKCQWFTIFGQKAVPKVIPEDVMEIGCNKYKNTEMSGLEQHRYIIELFDGEIISDKYERPIFKRKWVKSPHKYSHRKDAQ